MYSFKQILSMLHNSFASPDLIITKVVAVENIETQSAQATGLKLQARGLKLQATGRKLQTTGLKLQTTGVQLQASSYRPLATGFKLLALSYRPQATGLRPQTTGRHMEIFLSPQCQPNQTLCTAGQSMLLWCAGQSLAQTQPL